MIRSLIPVKSNHFSSTVIAIALLSFVSLFGEEKAPEKTPSPATPLPSLTSSGESKERSFLSINPKNRSGDYVQAYDVLKKDKPTLKIALKTNASLFANISEISASENGTLLFVKTMSNQGARLIVIPVEEVIEIGYSP